MGLFSPDIDLQQLAAASGRYSYPQIGSPKQNTVIIDEFQREALNPTDTPEIYTAASNDSNGTATIASGNALSLATDSSAIGDDESVRTSGIVFNRAPNSLIDGRGICGV